MNHAHRNIDVIGIKQLVILLWLNILKVYSEHDHLVLIMDKQIIGPMMESNGIGDGI